MTLIALVVVANLAATPNSTLTLEKIRSVDDPSGFDLRDPHKGDRGVSGSCSLAGKTTVTLVSGQHATLEVDRHGLKKSIVVENVRGLGRPTLACGNADEFYFANPRQGQLYAYRADRLFRGEDPVAWTRRVSPFTSMDDANGIMTDASVATVVQTRQKLVLVEWFFRKDGKTGFWHEIFDGATGAQIEKLGPSDLLVKTNESDPWWIFFQGGGNEVANYVPQNLYRLKYGPLANGDKPASEALVALQSETPPRRVNAVAKLSANPVVNHMIALLSPTRTAKTAAIEFCPSVPAQRARYWLGAQYDEALGTLARNILLAFWAERQNSEHDASPVDAWFRGEIAPHEPMKTLLLRFNPQDDAWIAQYQQALLGIGGPTLEELFAKYGRSAGAFTGAPAAKGAP